MCHTKYYTGWLKSEERCNLGKPHFFPQRLKYTFVLQCFWTERSWRVCEVNFFSNVDFSLWWNHAATHAAIPLCTIFSLFLLLWLQPMSTPITKKTWHSGRVPFGTIINTTWKCKSNIPRIIFCFPLATPAVKVSILTFLATFHWFEWVVDI